jgi:3-oxoacyl-[acyl-carrier-protein] synthase-1
VKHRYTIYQQGHSIVSPLAHGSLSNYEAIASGKSCLQSHQGKWDIPEPFFASLFPDGIGFDELVIAAAKEAIDEACIDASNDRVLFVLSTTKGNVDLLEHPETCDSEQTYLWHSAQAMARHFGNRNTALVASNACISGCAAQLTAYNMLQYSEQYDHVVVVGAEVLSKFIIAGFQSFKALSPERCHPFDQNRCGLNLGEAAAAIVYGRTTSPESLPPQTIIMEAGAINNDANHISGPSRTGEGLLRSIIKVTHHFDLGRIAFINAHGTATLYNDDMESVAINRAGLQDTPVNSLKGYYGHTLGAAGIMEVILSSIALQRHTIIKSLGTEQPGTAQPINVCTSQHTTNGDAFLKLISGFGGSNAALLFSMKQDGISRNDSLIEPRKSEYSEIKSIELPLKGLLSVNEIDEKLSQFYHDSGMQYPKFFKMDRLCKAGILGAELLLKDYDYDHENVKADWGIILMNSASSLDNDRRFQETIATDNYYPSPSVFVYTLANIVTGEIAIRHKIGGESSFYVVPALDQAIMDEMLQLAYTANPELTHIICGWVNIDRQNCEVKMLLTQKRKL